jgi:hypothetical protein
MQTSEKQLHLDRRSFARVSHHYTARFVIDPKRPLLIGQALTQDIGMRGALLLTNVIPETRKPFPVWIPLGDDRVLSASAQTAWTGIEDTLGDSAYWVKLGVTLTYHHQEDRAALAEVVARKTNRDIALREFETHKIGYIF